MKKFLSLIMGLIGLAALFQACGPSSLDLDESSKFDVIQLKATPKGNGVELEILNPGSKSGEIEIARFIQGADADYQVITTIPASATLYLDRSAVSAGAPAVLEYKARRSGSEQFPWSNAILSEIQEYTAVPLKPEKAIVNAISPTAIQIRWEDDSVDASTQGIRLVLKEIPAMGAAPEKILNFGVLVREYLAENGKDGVVIKAATKYSVLLEAYNTVGAVRGDGVEITTPAVPANPSQMPNTPTMTSFLQISADKLRARWTVGPTVLPDAMNGLELYVCKGGVCDLTNPIADFTKVATLNGNVLSYDYTIPNLPQPNGTRFGAVIRAKKGTNFSPVSNKIELQVFNATQAPGAAELIQVQQLANKKFNLLWDDPVDGDPATSFKVYFRKNGACSLSVDPMNADLVATLGANANSYLHDASALVASGDTVCYFLTAANAIGESDGSNSISLIVSGGGGGPIGAPVLNQANLYNPSTASLQWTKASGATSYKVVVQTGSACDSPSNISSWPVKGTYGDVASASVNFGIAYEGQQKCFAVLPFAGSTGGSASNVLTIVANATMATSKPLLINSDTLIAEKSVKNVWNYGLTDGVPGYIEFYDCVGAQAACDPDDLSKYTLRATKQSSELQTYAGGVQAVYKHFYTPTYPWASGSTVWFMIRSCNSFDGGSCTRSDPLGKVSTY